MSKKSDLFLFLKRMCEGDFSYIDTLTDDEVKALSPFVLLMWVAGAENDTELHTIHANTFCNPFVFSLSQHPRFLLKLFFASNSGIGNTRFSFKKSVSGQKSAIIKKIGHYYQCGFSEAREYFEMMDKNELKHFEDMVDGAF